MRTSYSNNGLFTLYLLILLLSTLCTQKKKTNKNIFIHLLTTTIPYSQKGLILKYYGLLLRLVHSPLYIFAQSNYYTRKRL